MDLDKAGTLVKHGVKKIGANADAIDKGEDRLRFKEAMLKIGLDLNVGRVCIRHPHEIGHPIHGIQCCCRNKLHPADRAIARSLPGEFRSVTV